MFRSLTLVLASLAAGCDYYTNNYYYNNEVVEDTGTEIEDDTAEDTGTEIEDDTAEDTGTEIEDDTATDDTAVEDTATDDTGIEPTCEFEVETWDGTVIMGNTLTVVLSSASPSGVAVPGMIEVLRLNFGVNDFECQDLTITGMTIFGVWTDNAGTDWAPESVFAVDLTTGENLGDAAISQPGTIIYAGFTMDDRIDAGETHSIAFYADLGGASAAEDDSVRFDLYLDSIGVRDESSEHVLRHDGVSGNTIVF